MPPEPGQLVEVRRRQWIVADVHATASSEFLKSSLVKLSSIDEDSLGEEIEVLWELEPGAHVIERSGLPTMTGLDDSDELDAFLDAVRWGAATNADRGHLQAPFRSGVSIVDFQLDPLVRAIDMARTNLLIADDVGLGKTIEAGLVIQEMLLRHRARTILVLCPASLQQKWKQEMAEKFGLEFRIVNTEYVKGLRRKQGLHANPWTSFPRLITSIDWVKQGEGARLLRDVLPTHPTFPRRFDLLVIDEAHHVAPKVGKYAVESLRTRIARVLAPHFEHKLFLTATPHDGYTESFTALLELLDDQRFSRNVMPPDEQLARVMVRRLKTDLVDEKGEPIYPRRILEPLKVDLTEGEIHTRNLLDQYIASRQGNDSKEGAASHFVHQLLRKRLSSSPAAFATTLERHISTLNGRSAEKDRGKSCLEDRILRRAIANADENFADDTMREAAGIEAVEEATKRMRSLSQIEQKLLAEMRDWARTASRRPDSKATALLRWLEKYIRPNGCWQDARVILFTEYRTTQLWLHEILAGNEMGGDRFSLIYGGMDPDEREAVKAAFQANPEDSPVRILLATDAAAEGIDLQNHCNLLIHIEIPYNPNVMEQRNGRIDRHGQNRDEVIIWHPVDSRGNQGEDILRALRKLEAMRADMGSVNPVIAPQLPAILEGRQRSLSTAAAEKRIEQSRRVLKVERDIRERITKLHGRLEKSREEQNLIPDYIERTVRVALSLSGKAPLVPTTLRGFEGPVYTMPSLAGSWARCSEGLEHPYTRRIRPITFDHEIAQGRDDVVLAHLNHPLVQMSLRLLRAEVWARDDVKCLNRVTVRTLPDDQLESPALVAVSRLVITGGSHHRLHEELTNAGGYLHDKSFQREDRVNTVRTWLDRAEPTEIVDSIFDAMRQRYEKHADAIMGVIESRSKERLRTLENTLRLRKERELADMDRVLDDLKKNLEAELAKELAPRQLELFTPDERTQIRRDRLAIEARLGRIPEERIQELAAIESRHSNFAEYTFPVAVILIVPESLSSESIS